MGSLWRETWCVLRATVYGPRTTLHVRLGILLVLLFTFVSGTSTAVADARNRAGLVVHFGDGSVQTACVSFEDEHISGTELLQRSPFHVIMGQSGSLSAAVCKVEDEGCDFPVEPCFCRCQFPECTYWAYFWMTPGGEWTYAQVGAAGREIQHGDVDGWSWGEGESGEGGVALPLITFDAICSEETEVTSVAASGAGDLSTESLWFRYGSFALLLVVLLAGGGLVLWRRSAA